MFFFFFNKKNISAGLTIGLSSMVLYGCMPVGPNAGEYIGTTTGALTGLALSSSSNAGPVGTILATGIGAAAGNVIGTSIDRHRAYKNAINQQRIREEAIRSLEYRSNQQYIDSGTGMPITIVPVDRYRINGREYGKFRCIVNPGPNQFSVEGNGYRNGDGSWSISIPQ